MELVDNEFLKRKEPKPKPIALTDRDTGILKFILDMKFASRAEVYQKFFRVTKDGGESVNDLWAKERLAHLCKSGFLKKQKVYTESKSYYQVTRKATEWLKVKYLFAFIGKPLKEIDFRNFAHDKLALQCRLRFEALYPDCSWVSDKELNENPFYKEKLDKRIRPDAIITTAEFKKIAFELEISTKAKDRYRQKVNRYVDHIRWQKPEKRLFDSVYFLCAKDSVHSLLEKHTEVYGDLFDVSTVNGFWER